MPVEWKTTNFVKDITVMWAPGLVFCTIYIIKVTNYYFNKPFQSSVEAENPAKSKANNALLEEEEKKLI